MAGGVVCSDGGDETERTIPCDFARKKAEANAKVLADADEVIAEIRKKRTEAIEANKDETEAEASAHDAMDGYRRDHVARFARQLGLPEEDIVHKVCSGDAAPLDLAMAVAMKSVSRTGWQEAYQYRILCDESRLLSDLVLLPKSTTKSQTAEWLVGGRIVTSKPPTGKTIDFRGKVAGMTAVVAAKHTEGSGGAQDNQRLDLCSFGEQAGPVGEEPLVILLADGSHYTEAFHKEQNEHFRAAGKNVIVTSTENLDRSIADWAKRCDIDLDGADDAKGLPVDFDAEQASCEDAIRSEFRAWHAEMSAKMRDGEEPDWTTALARLKSARGKEGDERKKNDRSRYDRIISVSEELNMPAEDLIAAMFGHGDVDAGETFARLVVKKSASRTGWQEDSQLEFLRDGSAEVSLPEKALPKDGPQARYLSGGKVVSKRPRGQKSIDFMGRLKEDPGTEVVVAAKYAEVSGGAQDNQMADLRKFGRNAPERGAGGPLVILLADGDYYTKPRHRGKQASRIQEMQEEFADRNVIVTDTAHLDQEIAKWREETEDEAARQ